MQARLYRAAGEARDFVDGYTLVFPYPKWYILETRNSANCCFLGCSPSINGTMIRCCWDEGHFHLLNLGRKVRIETMPEPFQQEVQRMQTLWDEVCKTHNFDRWNKEA